MGRLQTERLDLKSATPSGCSWRLGHTLGTICGSEAWMIKCICCLSRNSGSRVESWLFNWSSHAGPSELCSKARKIGLARPFDMLRERGESFQSWVGIIDRNFYWETIASELKNARPFKNCTMNVDYNKTLIKQATDEYCIKLDIQYQVVWSNFWAART
jgi:hypothetical protein